MPDFAHRKRDSGLAAAMRREQILDLRMRGLSSRKIAEQIGCGKTTVTRHIDKALEKLAESCDDKARILRAEESARLDMLWGKCIEELESAEDSSQRLHAIETARRISESRRKLWGTDAQPDIALLPDANLTIVYETVPVPPRQIVAESPATVIEEPPHATEGTINQNGSPSTAADSA